MHWLVHFLGMDNLSGYSYGFWSGFGSDIAEFAILGGVIQIYRKHNCHTKGCWRVGRHTIAGTPWCNRHHVSARPAQSMEEILGDMLAETRALREAVAQVTTKGMTDG